jgi:hypothetical protein
MYRIPKFLQLIEDNISPSFKLKVAATTSTYGDAYLLDAEKQTIDLISNRLKTRDKSVSKWFADDIYSRKRRNQEDQQLYDIDELVYADNTFDRDTSKVEIHLSKKNK